MKRKILMIILLLIATETTPAEKMRIAIMDFQGKDVSTSIANTVSELIRTEMINTGRYIVIERAQMGEILKEQGLQQAGCTDISCAVEVGKILSAKKILIGNIMKLGKTLIINGRIVDVEKGVAEFGEKQNVNSEDDLFNGVNLFTKNLTKRIDVADVSSGEKTAEKRKVEKEAREDPASYAPIDIPNLRLTFNGSYLMSQGKFKDVADSGYGGTLNVAVKNALFDNSLLMLNLGYYMFNPAQPWIDSVSMINMSVFLGLPMQIARRFSVTPAVGGGYLVHIVTNDPRAKYANGKYEFTNTKNYYDPMAVARLEFSVAFSSSVQLMISPTYIYFFEKSSRNGLMGGDAGFRFSF
jgi:TolB-like protein